MDAKFREAFGVAVCRTCRLQEALVSKSKALERYLLKEKDRECTRRRRYGRCRHRFSFVALVVSKSWRPASVVGPDESRPLLY